MTNATERDLSAAVLAYQAEVQSLRSRLESAEELTSLKQGIIEAADTRIRELAARLESAEREREVFAQLEVVASEEGADEWDQWTMRQAQICHGGNASATIRSAIAEARKIVAQSQSTIQGKANDVPLL